MLTLGDRPAGRWAVLARWVFSLRWVRWAAWGAAALLGVALLIGTAWVLSNWNDIEPVPRPPELVLPTPKVSDERNAFFTLVGLSAPAGQDPAVAGRVEWAARMASAARARPAAVVAGAGASAPASTSASALALATAPAAASAATTGAPDRAAAAQLLASPNGAPLMCGPPNDDCTAAWIAQAQALAAQREKYASWGQRCDQLAAAEMAFEERLPAFLSAADPIAPHVTPAINCSRWLLSGAVLAWAQGRSDDAVARLTQAARFNRSMALGSHSLIAQMVVLRAERWTLQTITALATRDAGMATALLPLATLALPDQAATAQRWMAVEAAFQRGMFDELAAQCPHPATSPVSDDAGPWNRLMEGASNWLMCHRIGWHPHRIQAATDTGWLHIHSALRAGVLPALRQLGDENRQQLEQQARGFSFGPVPLSWRNTFGEVLLTISRPAYDSYLPRHADLELHHEAAALAVAAQAAQVPAASRAAWLANQRLSDDARARLSFSADGLTLAARTWAEDRAAGEKINQRDAIRIRWPGALDAPAAPITPITPITPK